jgi:Family of unknown function (DUF6049)
MAAIAGALAVLGALAVPAVGQTQPTTAATPALILVAQDAWVPTGGVFTMHLRTESSSGSPPVGLNLTLTLHDPVTTRSAFDDSLKGTLPSTSGSTISAPFDSLAIDANGDRVFSIALQTATDQSADRLAARRPGGGVYPLEVQLRNANDTPVDKFVTHVVVVDVVPGSVEAGAPTLATSRPLDVAWVWPLTADPAYLPDGTPDPAVVDQLLPTGRLGRQAAVIDSLTNFPITLAPSPETLDAWLAIARQTTDVASGIAAIQRAASRNEILAGPFVPLDLPALVAAGHEGSLDSEFTRGTTILDRVIGTRLDPRTALPGPLDQHSAQILRQRGVDRMVLEDPSVLSPTTETLTPAHPYTVQATPGDDTTAVTAVVADAGIQRLFASDEPPALRAAHVLAALAFIEREQPSVTRGVVIVNPSQWDAPQAFLDALGSGLRNNPLVHTVTVDGLIADVPVADGPARTFATRAPTSAAPVTAKQFGNAFLNLGAINNLLGAGDPRVARGERALFSSLSSAWQTTGGRAKARALLAGIGTSANDFLSRIRIPSSTTVTITSSRAEIPITFRNDTGQKVRVHVTLQSDKLLFPDGNERDLDLPLRSTTARFTVETRSSGTFPVIITVTTAGNLPIQSTELRVRSTFVSGVGIFLTVAAILFLALWWGWDIRKRRRAKAHATADGTEGPHPVVAPAQA